MYFEILLKITTVVVEKPTTKSLRESFVYICCIFCANRLGTSNCSGSTSCSSSSCWAVLCLCATSQLLLRDLLVRWRITRWRLGACGGLRGDYLLSGSVWVCNRCVRGGVIWELCGYLGWDAVSLWGVRLALAGVLIWRHVLILNYNKNDDNFIDFQTGIPNYFIFIKLNIIIHIYLDENTDVYMYIWMALFMYKYSLGYKTRWECLSVHTYVSNIFVYIWMTVLV